MKDSDPAAFFRPTNKFRFAFRVLTAPARRLPSIVIPGAMKCGTTSLYHYLLQHPDVRPSFTKEVKYFDTSLRNKHRSWYRAHFPVTGRAVDASTSYLLYEESADHIAALLQDAYLVILVREPAARAWSHYLHQLRRGRESQPWDAAIEADIRAYELEGMPRLDDFKGRQFSYVRRGLYATQIRWYLDRFHDKVLVVRSEDMYADPQAALDIVCDHVELNRFSLAHPTVRNRSKSVREKPDLSSLRDWYAPHNDALYSLCDRDFWQTENPDASEPTNA